MKLSPTKQNQASVLAISLITGAVIATVLASLLALISSRYKLTLRSMAWNATIPVLEAGIEEAMSHLKWDSNTPIANGWAADVIGGQAVFTKTRTLPDNSYYYVAIYNANLANPLIYSTGFIPSPLENNKYISRQVRVMVTNTPTTFIRAIATQEEIRLTGSASVDGYNSNLGAYDAATNRNASGGIATNSQQKDAVKLGGGDINGKVSTGAAGTIKVGGGAIGDLAWTASNPGTIQPGWTDNTMNVAFPTNGPPSGPFATPITISVGGSNITSVVAGTNLLNSYTSTKSANPMVVTGNATLYVTGDVKLSGGAYIYLQPGASLTLYLGGDFINTGGGVVNGTGTPSRLSIIGLTTCKDIKSSNDGTFFGTINAPQADIVITGDGDFYGAAIALSYTATGKGSFHYDQALTGGSGGPIVTVWTEL